MGHKHTKDLQMRQRLAQAAAQILAETGSRDFYAAKRKAALHLGAVDTRNMPSNTEIDQALREYQRLFRADAQQAALQQLRSQALQAMEFFADFKPRLVGSVLDGSADVHSPVVLHVFALRPEDLDLFLLEHKIPYEQGERRVKFSADQTVTLPVLRFLAGDTRIELVVFVQDGPHQPPLSPVDGRPMQRASVTRVRELLASEVSG
jgi:hypothetical protein